MAVQQRRTSKHRRDKRRSHHALQASSVRTCSKCGTVKLSHRVCQCGMYRNKRITNAKIKRV